ncbi:MAG: DUF2125 domain-containing protein [Yoonia sp.]|nr:DUF2125 domain-containing protein [Yoonia sp.]
MRRLTFIVIGLAALYGGYWFIGATALSKGIDAQISAMKADGWTVQTTDLTTEGFPSRFDTSASDITLGTPDRGVIWRVPFAQANALSYRPNEVILVLPEHQELDIDGKTYEVQSDGLKASASIAANTTLDLTNFTAQTGPLSVDGLTGELVSVSNGIVALRPSGPAPLTYDVYANLDGLTLPAGLRRLLDPTSALPETFAQSTIDGTVTLAAALDRHALTAADGPQIDAFKINGMTLTWGKLSLRATGEVTIDSAGIPTGKLTLSAQNWSQMLDIAVKAGIIDQAFVRTVMNMAMLMAGGSTDLTVPVSFQNAMMSLGPIPVGPAPRFR